MNSKPIILPLLLAFCLGPTRTHGLDLTPSYGFRELEGVKIPVVLFEDDARKVQWQPPGDWKVSRGDNALMVIPPGKANAGMELRIIPRTVADVSDGMTDPQALAAWVEALLPIGSAKATFVREIPSPFLLDALTSRELTFTYNYQGKDLTTSIALVNLDAKSALSVMIYGTPKDFDSLHDEGTRSMFRWAWIRSQGNPPQANAGAQPK